MKYDAEFPAVLQASTLSGMFDAAFEAYGDHIALVCKGTRLSYRNLDFMSRNLAAYLQSLRNLSAGERVAVMLPNSLEYCLSVIAVLRAGMVVVNINPHATGHEACKFVGDSGARVVITLPALVGLFSHDDTLHVIEADTAVPLTAKADDVRTEPYQKNHVRFDVALHDGRFHRMTIPPVTPDSLAFLQYTGGTTGISKAAMLSHGNIMANIVQMKTACGDHVSYGEERVVTALPLYHIFSLTVNFLFFAATGGTNILIPDARNTADTISAMQRYRFTAFAGVNTLYSHLLAHPDFRHVDFSFLRFCVSGGTELSRRVAEQWLDITQKAILVGYGMTECSPLITVQPFDTTDCQDNAGFPVADTHIRIVDAEGRDMADGEKGEVLIRGPQVMSGYWNRPDETRAVLSDGWFSTGDLATRDHRGCLKLEGRKKEMIIVSGFNVYPVEIETVLLQHPAISEAAVTGVQDKVTGEAVCAFIVIRPENAVTEHDVRAHCRQYLTSYKIPCRIHFLDTLPKSGVGKILKYKLKDMLS
ncbi:long-chain-fatty-acid--CoA ligase [Enterobacter ludwigii]|uniref:long-chain-fatty-acid--CoA ligase n=1 Tax=Enterobacter ludwigii TaxID=299767 RepID=UPI003F702BB0